MKSNATRAAVEPWYARAFRADYLRRYAHRDDETASREIAFAVEALGLPPGAAVLDLCCGAGRHSRALARAGFKVTGLDLSPDLLREARTHGGGIRYVRGDMRKLPFPAQRFDAVVNLFTSFGYFSTDAQNARVLKEVHRVLKPGAPFLLDFFNLRATLAQLKPESERCVEGVVLRERRCFDPRTKRLVKTVTGPGVRIRESVRGFSPAELTALLRMSGFRKIQRFGTLDGEPFDPRLSPRCVMLAKRKA